MAVFSISAVIFTMVLAGTDAEQPAVHVFENQGNLIPQGKLDELVFERLKRLGIQPANLCSDAVFVRRVSLDLIGTLPTAEEAGQFLQDRSPSKRAALIDRLLLRKEFADYWAMKWSDLLRIKAEFPINLWPRGVQAYHRWIRAALQQNIPYDQFVRELLTASGSSFHVPQVNFYRALQNREPKAIAQMVALTFMGARADRWPTERWTGTALLFSQIGYKPTGEWKEEIVFNDSLKAAEVPPSGAARQAVFPDGTPVQWQPDQDPRELLADWLITPKNPWFARHIANRIWYWLLGRGIVHEPDDIRPDNPARNPELLNYLGDELIAAHYDLKHIYRLILNSTTYQLSPIPRSEQAEAEAEFAYYPLRRLDAEVLIDALCQITGTTEDYFSRIPEPYSMIPANQRSITLADGSTTSSFLELFGRPPRDTGFESERNNRPSGDQRLHLLNSSHIQKKIQESSKLRSLTRVGHDSHEVANKLYLTILSRLPTDEESAAVRAFCQSGKVKPPDDLIDVAWALVNSPEFSYRH
jgi:hypothetical protein